MGNFGSSLLTLAVHYSSTSYAMQLVLSMIVDQLHYMMVLAIVNQPYHWDALTSLQASQGREPAAPPLVNHWYRTTSSDGL